MALLAAGLLCITSFSACDDDDDKDKEKTYAYEMVLELTESGDLSQSDIQALNSTFQVMKSQVGTQHATSAAIKRIFDENVSSIKTSVGNLVGTMSHTNPVKVTFGFSNTDTKKLEVSQIFEFK